jgi:hypothetical protein
VQTLPTFAGLYTFGVLIHLLVLILFPPSAAFRAAVMPLKSDCRTTQPQPN